MTGDLYLLRAVVELDLALEAGMPVDAAHAVVTDLADEAFGPGWQQGYGAALAAEGLADPARLVADDDLAGRVLARLREAGGTPGPPDPEFGWYAYPPGAGAGRGRFRRAVRHGGTTRQATLRPARPRVAGRPRRD